MSILEATPKFTMKANVGSYDAAVRFVVACGIFWLGVHVESWWGLLGLAPLATSVASFCPLYLPFHFDTIAADELPL